MSNLETNVALLEQKINSTDTVLERLADSFAKISDVSNSLTKMLAVHEERFSNQAAVNKEIDRTIDEIVKDNKVTQAEFFKHMETNENKVMLSIEEMRKDLKERDAVATKAALERDEKIINRITILENWRWYIIGISTAGGFIASQVISYVTK